MVILRLVRTGILAMKVLLGIVAAFAYKNEQSNYEKKDIELDGDATQTQVENDKRVTGTDTKVKFSAMFNMGL